MQGIKYHISEPDHYHANTRPKQYQRQQNQNVYLPPSSLSKTYIHCTVEAEEEPIADNIRNLEIVANNEVNAITNVEDTDIEPADTDNINKAETEIYRYNAHHNTDTPYY